VPFSPRCDLALEISPEAGFSAELTHPDYHMERNVFLLENAHQKENSAGAILSRL
jgi:hypothetical protein